MKRILMQVYIKGSVEAVQLYQKAFGGTLGYHVKNKDGSYYHSELEVDGHIISVAECDQKEYVTGNTMQFCLEFGEGQEAAVQKAYEVLQERAQINVPLAPCEFSTCMTDLVDKFGVRWCLYV